MTDNLMCIEVAYALPERQKIVTVNVPVGTTMFDAAVQSQIVDYFSDLDLETATMGVFSKIEKTPKTRIMKSGERIEIYRPLINDPKEARKARAAKAKEKSQL